MCIEPRGLVVGAARRDCRLWGRPPAPLLRRSDMANQTFEELQKQVAAQQKQIADLLRRVALLEQAQRLQTGRRAGVKLR